MKPKLGEPVSHCSPGCGKPSPQPGVPALVVKAIESMTHRSPGAVFGQAVTLEVFTPMCTVHLPAPAAVVRLMFSSRLHAMYGTPRNEKPPGSWIAHAAVRHVLAAHDGVTSARGI